jgi:hypothetical protein
MPGSRTSLGVALRAGRPFVPHMNLARENARFWDHAKQCTRACPSARFRAEARSQPRRTSSALYRATDQPRSTRAETLVCGIRQRVSGLGEHRGGSADQSSAELCQEDGNVRRQRDRYSPATLACGPASA